MTFTITISDVFLENFIKIFHVAQKTSRFSLSILAVFTNFLIFTCCKKLTTSAYTRWCEQLVDFNLLKIDCLTAISSYNSAGLVFLEIWMGGVCIKLNPQTKIFSKSPALLRLTFRISSAIWYYISFIKWRNISHFLEKSWIKEIKKLGELSIVDETFSFLWWSWHSHYGETSVK